MLLDLVYIYPGGVRTGLHLFFFLKSAILKHPNVHSSAKKLIWALREGCPNTAKHNYLQKLSISFFFLNFYIFHCPTNNDTFSPAERQHWDWKHERKRIGYLHGWTRVSGRALLQHFLCFCLCFLFFCFLFCVLCFVTSAWLDQDEQQSITATSFLFLFMFSFVFFCVFCFVSFRHLNSWTLVSGGALLQHLFCYFCFRVFSSHSTISFLYS